MVLLYSFKTKMVFNWYKLKTILWYRLFFKSIGKNCVIFSPTILTPESIILGNNVSIGWRARIEGVKQYQSEKFNPKIILSDGVSIQQNIHLTCADSIQIGKNTAIAANVSITDIHHPYDDINIPIEQQNIKTKPVFIGENCKIYNNAVIMQGTKIGKHCTIAANSIVSGDFQDFCVIVGAPAKTVKRYSFEKQAWLKTDANGNFIEI
ncbi:acyltransferase [Chryseobacterium indoltheticum]|uniref:acyltransferase n=1 Tax=Chryseobacterium indoltheticum TaxID=254 RepID=UPI0028EAFDE0|nr:acyltransferase [Chryseobacterium indoltheticum]